MTAILPRLVDVVRAPHASAGACEYLVSHGKSGGFGRFTASVPPCLQRGDWVVVQTLRGLEIGNVLCAASARHVQLLASTPPGRIVRRAEPADDEAQRSAQLLGRQIFEEGRAITARLGLALELVDVEILLDRSSAIIQFLGKDTDDCDSLANALQATFGLKVLLENLALSPPQAEEHEHGCGKPDCGKVGGGGCTSCGCSSCGSGKVDMTAYFAHLRGKMDHRFRTPLL